MNMNIYSLVQNNVSCAQLAFQMFYNFTTIKNMDFKYSSKVINNNNTTSLYWA